VQIYTQVVGLFYLQQTERAAAFPLSEYEIIISLVDDDGITC